MNIVYVQIGKAKYNFVSRAIKRSISLFPDMKHYLITDNTFYRRKVSKYAETHLPSGEIFFDDLKNRNIDTSFRNNYWNLTLSRILAVIEFQISNELNEVLHVESDVILLPNFPFNEFVKENKISWCVYGDGLDVASILYIPNSVDAIWLRDAIEKELREEANSTDMMILNRIKNKYPEIVNSLPGSLTSHAPDCISKPKNKNREVNSPSISGINGVFDGITLGMWLTGQDPKNNLGRYKIRDNSPYIKGATFINPSSYKYFMANNSQLFLKCKFCDSTNSVWNLHVHSKNRRLLSLDWAEELQKLCSTTEYKNKFSINALFWMINNAYQSKNLTKFLLELPFSKSVLRSGSRIIKGRKK